MAPATTPVRVITDGAAALNPDVAAVHDIGVVPMTVEVAGKSVTEAEAGQLAAGLGEGSVRTSAPAPAQYLAAIGDAGAAAGAVIVTVADSLSASHRAARLAARIWAASHATPVEVVDSGSAAGAQALVALAAARAAAAGMPAADVAGAARRAAAETRLLGAVGSLDALVRSGRVPRTAGSAGRLVGVQPMFELRAGRVRALRPAFSRSAAIDRMVAAVRRDRPADGVAEIAISHAGAEADAAELLARLTRVTSPALAIVGDLGAAMVAHAGAGTLGISWLWRR